MQYINSLRGFIAMESDLFPAIGLMPTNIQEVIFRVHISYINNENQSIFSYFNTDSGYILFS